MNKNLVCDFRTDPRIFVWLGLKNMGACPDIIRFIIKLRGGGGNSH